VLTFDDVVVLGRQGLRLGTTIQQGRPTANVTEDELREALVDAWLANAPPALAASYLRDSRG